MDMLTRASDREARARACTTWARGPAGPWPALQVGLKGAGKWPGTGEATRSRSPLDGEERAPPCQALHSWGPQTSS